MDEIEGDIDQAEGQIEGDIDQAEGQIREVLVLVDQD